MLDSAGHLHHGRPLRASRTTVSYGDVYRLTYLRCPSGIIVMLAQELTKG